MNNGQTENEQLYIREAKKGKLEKIPQMYPLLMFSLEYVMLGKKKELGLILLRS